MEILMEILFFISMDFLVLDLMEFYLILTK